MTARLSMVLLFSEPSTTEPTTSQETGPRYLTRKAAAAYLTRSGIPVQTNTLAHWASNGRYALPMIKLGTLVRYDTADLDALIESHKVTTD